jgi:hypothetical protein
VVVTDRLVVVVVEDGTVVVVSRVVGVWSAGVGGVEVGGTMTDPLDVGVPALR